MTAIRMDYSFKSMILSAVKGAFYTMGKSLPARTKTGQNC
jgi:hypothetical protein